jgi:hypothetical protein
MGNVAKYQWYNNKSWPYAVDCYLSREFDPHRLPTPIREWLRRLLIIIHRELQNFSHLSSHCVVVVVVGCMASDILKTDFPLDHNGLERFSCNYFDNQVTCILLLSRWHISYHGSYHDSILPLAIRLVTPFCWLIFSMQCCILVRASTRHGDVHVSICILI